MIEGPWYERFWWLIKVIAFLLSCWFIYFHVQEELVVLGDAHRQFFNAEDTSVSNWLYVILLLAFLNWSLEAIKWKYLIREIEKVSFLKALRAFFNGITLSFFTPNRAGEFAGRIIYLQPENRVKGALLSIIGSSAQLLVTVQTGFIALIYFLPRFVDLDQLQLWGIRLLFLALILLLSWGWLHLPKLVRITDKLNIRLSWKEKMHVWDQCKSADLHKVWWLSLLRYFVFTMQQVLLYKALSFSPSPLIMIGLSAISFLLITLIPSIALGELGIRGSVNIAVFGFAGALPSTILVATFALWCLNLVFPAVFGATSVLFLKIRKKVSAAGS